MKEFNEEQAIKNLLRLLEEISDTPLHSVQRYDKYEEIKAAIDEASENDIGCVLIPIGVVVPFKGFIWRVGTPQAKYHTILSD